MYWLHKDPQIPGKTQARAHLHEIAKPTLIIVGEDALPYFYNIPHVIADGISSA